MKGLSLALGFAVLLAFDTLGQVGFKLVADHTSPVLFELDYLLRLIREPWALAVVVAYLGAFITYMSLMKYAPIGPLFAASHLDIVVIALVGVAFFHETLSLAQVAGCLTIIAGIAILSRDEANSG